MQRRFNSAGGKHQRNGRTIEDRQQTIRCPRAFCVPTFAFRFPKHGMTLPELLISMAILSMMSVVLAGMSNAVNSAWSYTKGVEESDLQARAAIERIRYMLSQTGSYRIAGHPTQLGLEIVQRTVGTIQVPDVLVLWTGGRTGGLASNGVQTRLPIVGELLIYTWDDSTPGNLVEVAFPGQTAVFDFADSDSAATVASLLSSSAAEKIPLCDRLRVSSLSTSGSSSTSLGDAAQSVGDVRFAVTLTPTDGDLASASPQTTTWTGLNWPQGNYGSRWGMRQATLRIELQVEPKGIVHASDSVSAIPFFGSGSLRFLYEP